MKHISIEVKPLTEETLAQYWKEAAVELGLEELRAEGIPRRGESGGCRDNRRERDSASFRVRYFMMS